jgi:hypothetical protein
MELLFLPMYSLACRVLRQPPILRVPGLKISQSVSGAGRLWPPEEDLFTELLSSPKVHLTRNPRWRRNEGRLVRKKLAFSSPRGCELQFHKRWKLIHLWAIVNTHVDLCDLLDDARRGGDVRVFDSEEELREYTISNGKIFH